MYCDAFANRIFGVHVEACRLRIYHFALFIGYSLWLWFNKPIIIVINKWLSGLEGTFVYDWKNGASPFRKTYRLEFEYDNFTHHLTEVKHSEVVGIGENVTDASWEKAWTWSNYLYWGDGNLKEFHDYYGQSTVQHAIKYDHSSTVVSYPVIIPPVINSYHHLPLFMQGIFGLNSNNLVSSASFIDADGNITCSCDFSYEFGNGYIKSYTETFCNGEAISSPIIHLVTWTVK